MSNYQNLMLFIVVSFRIKLVLKYNFFSVGVIECKLYFMILDLCKPVVPHACTPNLFGYTTLTAIGWFQELILAAAIIPKRW